MMKKCLTIIGLASITLVAQSVAVAAEFPATDIELPTITVEGTKLSDVSGEEVKSADLAEALVKRVPSISLVRRSGIANDIILRGQKKDNINITVDDTKVYGACPNRMDPPTSHILTNNIENIEITEGPYDVEDFGTLSGAVKITTKEPSQGFEGEASLNFGSWGYRKAAATVSGGNDWIRALISMSKETSDQYEDGNGDDFAEQIKNFTAGGTRFQAQHEDRNAYEKTTFMGKLFVDVTDNQKLKLSYTANRSDDVLYPSTPMDALYDDSDIFNLEYSITNTGKYSKMLDIQYYYSGVDHPMSNVYRNAGAAVSTTSDLSTEMQGLKIKNALDLNDTTELTFGVDMSKRNWDGHFETSNGAGVNGRISLADVDTNNRALFAEIEKRYTDFTLKMGARYDNTEIDPGFSHPVAGKQQSNDYDTLSGFVFGTYQASASTKLFGGVGKSSRVPDARELYYVHMNNQQQGTPTLDETTNYEIDFGFENSFDKLTVKTKLFHSWLKDYIYNSGAGANRFSNIDATVYGLDISGSYFFTDSVYFDFGFAYQKGEKDKPLAGETDKDLAEIPPLKANLALNYDYGNNNTARIELVAADDWDDFDGDNGEQAIDGYAVVNLKLDHEIANNFKVTAGVDNLFDRDYATTNTYQDMTLITNGNPMLINEPGRYLYVNATFSF